MFTWICKLKLCCLLEWVYHVVVSRHAQRRWKGWRKIATVFHTCGHQALDTHNHRASCQRPFSHRTFHCHVPCNLHFIILLIILISHHATRNILRVPEMGLVEIYALNKIETILYIRKKNSFLPIQNNHIFIIV